MFTLSFGACALPSSSPAPTKTISAFGNCSVNIFAKGIEPVSYTHLTLPTNREV